MNRVIVDPDTRTKLANARQTLELCDDSGRVLGHFLPIEDHDADSGREPRISDVEIARRLRCGGGRSLAEILADLEKKA
ncbi:MAG: hypothetical protein ACRELF_03830 [Gemmataceae bacterium]